MSSENALIFPPMPNESTSNDNRLERAPSDSLFNLHETLHNLLFLNLSTDDLYSLPSGYAHRTA